MAKPMPTLPPDGEKIAVLTPMTLPSHVEGRAARVAAVDRGVDLDEVVVRTARRSRGRRAETMPAVTVPPRPNGLPTAITASPTRTLLLSPNVT